MSTSYVFPTPFSTAAATATAEQEAALPDQPISRRQLPGPAATGLGLASFVCHVAYLEANLRRGDKSTFFDLGRGRIVRREPVGNGASFAVERGELEEQPPETERQVEDGSSKR